MTDHTLSLLKGKIMLMFLLLIYMWMILFSQVIVITCLKNLNIQ